MIRFVGGPCDGMVTTKDFGDESMMIHRGHSAFHLYDRIAVDCFEYCGSLNDESTEASTIA